MTEFNASGFGVGKRVSTAANDRLICYCTALKLSTGPCAGRWITPSDLNSHRIQEISRCDRLYWLAPRFSPHSGAGRFQSSACLKLGPAEPTTDDGFVVCAQCASSVSTGQATMLGECLEREGLGNWQRSVQCS